MSEKIIANLRAKGFNVRGFDDELFTEFQELKGSFNYYEFEDKQGSDSWQDINSVFHNTPQQINLDNRAALIGEVYNEELQINLYGIAINFCGENTSFTALYQFTYEPDRKKCTALSKLIAWKSSMTDQIEENKKTFRKVLCDIVKILL